MTSARTVFVFGLYLVLVGLGLALVPNTVLTTLGFAPTQDFWARASGGLVLCLATFYLVAARANLTVLIRTTIYLRFAVFGFLGGLVLFQFAPRQLALFGLVDLIAALWTASALKAERSAE